MDAKEKELENYSYNVKTLRLSRQKELDELRNKVDRFENQTKELERQHHNNREENDQLLQVTVQESPPWVTGRGGGGGVKGAREIGLALTNDRMFIL